MSWASFITFGSGSLSAPVSRRTNTGTREYVSFSLSSSSIRRLTHSTHTAGSVDSNSGPDLVLVTAISASKLKRSFITDHSSSETM